MTALESLRSARARIATPDRWTQSAAARDSGGRGVEATDPSAVCWCLIATLQLSRWLEHENALTAVTIETGGYLAQFNDTHTHAEVLAALDRAIARLESAPTGRKP